ncbi:hypothetical protein Bca4012_095066 [Brassica carinata]
MMLFSYPMKEEETNMWERICFKKGSVRLMYEMTSPTSNGTLKVIESNKSDTMPKFHGETNESCYSTVEKWG